jgi:hypothetical protein
LLQARFLLNNSQVSYLIQGQPFNLEYEIDGCSRVLIIYDNGESVFKRYKIQKNTGTFTSVTNVYAPTIRFIALDFGFKYVDFVLHVNFMNVVPMDISIQIAQPTSVEIPKIKTRHFKIESPIFSDENYGRINLLNNKIQIKPYDDLSEYMKQN